MAEQGTQSNSQLGVGVSGLLKLLHQALRDGHILNSQIALQDHGQSLGILISEIPCFFEMGLGPGKLLMLIFP